MTSFLLLLALTVPSCASLRITPSLQGMPSKLRVNKSTPPAEPRTRRLSARSHPLLKPLTPHRQKLLKAGDRSLPRAQDSSHLLHSQHSCHTITDFIPQAIHLEVHFSQAGLHQHHYPGCVCPQTGRCQLNYLHNPSPLSTAFIPRDRLLLHLQTSSASAPVPGKSSESITRLVQYLPWTPRLCGTAQQAEQSGLLKGFHYKSNHVPIPVACPML